MPEKIGVISPYALAEIVEEKYINWHKLEQEGNRDATLANILQTDEKKLFDLKTPILNPSLGVDQSGNAVSLSTAEVKDRIDTHWKGTEVFVPNTRGRFSAGQPAEMKRKKERIIRALTTVTENNTLSVGGDEDASDFDWVDKGEFLIESDQYDDPSPRRGLDPMQGAIPDCYLIAALSSVFWSRPDTMAFDSFINDIPFYNGNHQVIIAVSDRIPVRKMSRRIVYARSRNQGEIWPGVIEKAYAKWKSGHQLDKPPYKDIKYGNPIKACSELIKAQRMPPKYTKNNTSRQLWDYVNDICFRDRTGDPMVAWTRSSDPDYDAANIVPNHAYSILGCEEFESDKYIVLRNPYALKHATVGTRPGEWARFQLDQYGLFSMKADYFKRYFDGLGWVLKK